METKHTPGTWKFNSSDFQIESEGKLISLVVITNSEKEEAESNGILIEAAPELLESLTNVIDELEQLAGYYFLEINSQSEHDDELQKFVALKIKIETAKSIIKKATK